MWGDGVEGGILVGKSFKVFGIFPADFGIGAINLEEEFKGGHFHVGVCRGGRETGEEDTQRKIFDRKENPDGDDENENQGDQDSKEGKNHDISITLGLRKRQKKSRRFSSNPECRRTANLEE